MHFIFILALFAFCSPATAAFRPPVESASLPDGAALRVNRRTVLVLRRPSGSYAPLARVALIEERLAGAIEAGLVPAAVVVRRLDGQYGLFAGPAELARPSAADAREARTTPRRLAYRWAGALRQALALPPLTLSARSVLVPFGETRAVRVGGVAAGPLKLAPRDPSVVSAEVAGDGRSVRLRAGEPGQTVLAVEADGAMVGVRVEVKKYAGELAGPVTVDCTGRPAPAELVRQLVMENYPAALRLEPGARVTLAGKPRLPAAIPPGRDGWGRVPVKLSGPGLLPRSGTASVRVRCRRLPRRDANALLYSNNPERLLRPGRLYLGEVEKAAPCRLLYHHQNMAARPLMLHVDLVNPDEAAAEIQVVDGAAPPMLDTVLVGHRAGARYLRSAQRDVGRIISLPGRTRVPLLRQRLSHGFTASGLYGLRLLHGPRLWVEITAAAVAGREDPPQLLNAALPSPIPPPSLGRPAPSTPPSIGGSEREATRQGGGPAGPTEPSQTPERPNARTPERLTPVHVYPNPRRVLQAEYTVGRNWAFVRVGKKAIPGMNEGQVLYGNYGVLYDIAVRIANPTSESRVVRLMLAPDAGAARGVFLVEGRWIEAPSLSPPSEYELAQFLLSPQEQRVLNIRTLPIGGSAYPVTLVVR